MALNVVNTIKMELQSQEFRHHSIPLDILDDLASRFIINLPEPLRNDLIRICFQMEMAHWFYSDEYVADEVKASSYKTRLRNCNMTEFSKHMFRHIPFLRRYANEVDSILENWRQYKISVPTYGAILLNEDMSQVVLVQSYWNKTSWGFPKGKVNEEEAPHLCAVREVLEETGFNIAAMINPDHYAETVINDQLSRLFFIPGVPLNTEFCPRTKYEIRDIQWFPLDMLPASKKDAIPDGLNMKYNSLYMVMPFVRSIRKWIATQRRSHSSRSQRRHSNNPTPIPGLRQSRSGQGQQHYGSHHQPPFGSTDYVPKAWANFSIKKKEMIHAMDQIFNLS